MDNKNILNEIKKDLKRLADPEKERVAKRFFKTDKGDYGEGDEFYGIRVPELRKVARKYATISLDVIADLLGSKMHEERFMALVILVKQYEQLSKQFKKSKSLAKSKQNLKANSNSKLKSNSKVESVPESGTVLIQKMKKIFDFYLDHIDRINNWDLVDTSTPQIVGGYLLETEKDLSEPPRILFELAKSGSDRLESNVSNSAENLINLWSKRISIMATFTFIRAGHFQPTIILSKLLLHDSHDLMHKAVGWMLREVANRNRPVTEKFLDEHASQMPRTMLRYAIEKFPETLRKQYMAK